MGKATGFLEYAREETPHRRVETEYLEHGRCGTVDVDAAAAVEMFNPRLPKD